MKWFQIEKSLKKTLKGKIVIPDKIINLLKTKQITKKNSNMYVQKVKKVQRVVK